MSWWLQGNEKESGTEENNSSVSLQHRSFGGGHLTSLVMKQLGGEVKHIFEDHQGLIISEEFKSHQSNTYINEEDKLCHYET